MKTWKCLYCGRRLNRQLGLAETSRAGCKAAEVLHACGACKGLHLGQPDGTLRKLTTAEAFTIHLHYREQLEQAFGLLPLVPPGGAVSVVVKE